MDVKTIPENLLTTSAFYCMALFHSQTRRHYDKMVQVISYGSVTGLNGIT